MSTHQTDVDTGLDAGTDNDAARLSFTHPEGHLQGYFLDSPQSSVELCTATGRVFETIGAYPGVDVTDVFSPRLLDVCDGRPTRLSVAELRDAFEAASAGNGEGPDGSYAFRGRLHAVVGNTVLPLTSTGTGVIEVDENGETWQSITLVVDSPFGGAPSRHVGAFRYRYPENKTGDGSQ